MNIFKHSFDDLEGKELEEVKLYFSGCDCRSATCTFLANYAWRDNYDLRYEVIGNYLCVMGILKNDPEAKPVMLMPMPRVGCCNLDELKEVILEAKRRFDEAGVKMYIVSLSEHEKGHLEQIFSDQLKFYHDEDYDEYVYQKDKLITLSGRALHKKKNHMNYFLKNFSYDVTKILPEKLDEVMEFVVQCKVGKDVDEEAMESLHLEEDAIRRFVEHTDEPGIYSVAIYIDGALQAIALGEYLNHNTVAEHFEKANDAYRGLYQVVCSEFCKSLPEEIVYVNREEDMGLEYLRKAKEALRPDHKAVKYSCCFSNTVAVK